MGTHSSTLTWDIPWTEEPGGLQSTESQRVGHDLATKQVLCIVTRAYIHSFTTLLVHQILRE